MNTKHGRQWLGQVTCDWQRPGSWCRPGAHSKGRGGGPRPTGSPSLLLGNFSSCFLGTSYLQKRGEPLKASRWGAPCLRLSPGRREVCKSVCMLSKNLGTCQPGRLWGGLLTHPPILSSHPLMIQRACHPLLTVLFSNVLSDYREGCSKVFATHKQEDLSSIPSEPM